jgi:hypothetical protein
VRSFGAFLLVLLLLGQWLGLSVAVHTFRGQHRQASPVTTADEWLELKLPLAIPYAQPWANAEGSEGLVEVGGHFYNIAQQRYENDTLYTTLKTNLGAREQFAQLSEQIGGLLAGQPDPASGPTDGPAKLLKDCFKVYLPTLGLVWVNQLAQNQANSPLLPAYARFCPSTFLAIATPPPEV